MDTNFFAATMRLQRIHGERTDRHAVVSCSQCHGMMLAMNLDAHASTHVRGGVMDPTMHLEISADRKMLCATNG